MRITEAQHNPEFMALKIYQDQEDFIHKDEFKKGMPLGSLLISFFEYDFSNIDALNEITLDYGGLGAIYNICKTECDAFFEACEIPRYDAQVAALNKANIDLLSALKGPLEACQHDFKTALEYCLNTDNKPYLSRFSFFERYFIGTISANKPIPDLDIYNGRLIPEYRLDEKSESYLFYIKHYEWTDEQLSSEIKNDVSIGSEVYYAKDIRNLLFIEFQRLLQTSTPNMIKCANCKRLFISKNRSDEIYCDRIVLPGTRTCKQVGYEKKDEYIKAYRTAYKTKNAMKFRNMKNNSHAESDFHDWVIQAKNKLSEAQKGTISLNEFKKWLRES